MSPMAERSSENYETERWLVFGGMAKSPWGRRRVRQQAREKREDFDAVAQYPVEVFTFVLSGTRSLIELLGSGGSPILDQLRVVDRSGLRMGAQPTLEHVGPV